MRGWDCAVYDDSFEVPPAALHDGRLRERVERQRQRENVVESADGQRAFVGRHVG